MSIKEHPPLHVPVLLESVLASLSPKSGENYLDLTAGYGGHAKAILERTANYRESTLVDRDEFAISNLHAFEKNGIQLLNVDFVQAARELRRAGRKYDLVLLDLGVSSPQLDYGERGFSFTREGPLDMRMDNRQSLTAGDIVNGYTAERLAKIIVEYGEESKRTAERYAEAIVAARPIASTTVLAEIIRHAHVGRWQKTHPATRTFQAIRIQVNDELHQVSEVMSQLPELLQKGGRVGVISFHSLEDRIVKRYFADQAAAGYEAKLEVLTKHPILGSEQDDNNPRARSAKLRVAMKK
ncbi:MAG: 16S rRNA (cytosine(1402)-N(4))-methyltransferase RsmH [Candidatus Saccharimonas sp.]